MLAIEQTSLSLALALACSAVPWLALRLRGRLLAVGLVVGVLLAILGTFLSDAPYPWSNFVVLLTALTSGLLLGRGILPRARPFLVLLLILSALDVANIVLSGGLTRLPTTPSANPAAASSGPLPYLNFYLLLPGGHYLVGVFDLLVITAAAEHWRRRGASYPIALLPGVLGFLLAYGAVWLTGLGGWPLIPFFTAGWLASEGVCRALGQRAETPIAKTP
jgi:hypothetical protein